MFEKIKNIVSESIHVKSKLFTDERLIKIIESVTNQCIDTYNAQGKILFCGNGGSASDAQHIAAELSGRFYLDRPPLYAEALHVNASYMTAVSNDYGYEAAYSRLVLAMGNSGDVLIAISTSGNSKNIINAIVAAKEKGMKVVGMTGAEGGEMKDMCDFLINIPSSNTPRIQESHILVGHIICELIESKLFG